MSTWRGCEWTTASIDGSPIVAIMPVKNSIKAFLLKRVDSSDLPQTPGHIVNENKDNKDHRLEFSCTNISQSNCSAFLANSQKVKRCCINAGGKHHKQPNMQTQHYKTPTENVGLTTLEGCCSVFPAHPVYQQVFHHIQLVSNTQSITIYSIM